LVAPNPATLSEANLLARFVQRRIHDILHRSTGSGFSSEINVQESIAGY
jgi:hypothetical protein